MSPTEIIPLLLVVLLLLAGSGAEPDTMDVVFEGNHTLGNGTVDVGATPRGAPSGNGSSDASALVVGGGTVTVPANASVSSPVFVVGGDLRIEGQVDDVRVLAGNVTVTDSAAVAGQLEVLGGRASVADGATIGSRSDLAGELQGASPTRSPAGFLFQVGTLALVTGLLARRNPTLLDNVGDSVANHAAVSAVVGAIAGLSLLVLFVYMAFTLVLLPLSVVGLLVEFGIVVYSYAVFGYLVGRRLPVERVDLASAAGAGLFVIALELLSRIPLFGVLGQGLLVAVGFGAVLITYFGLREFEPAEIPG
jgi:hypothetical protein